MRALHDVPTHSIIWNLLNHQLTFIPGWNMSHVPPSIEDLPHFLVVVAFVCTQMSLEQKLTGTQGGTIQIIDGEPTCQGASLSVICIVA